MSSSRGSIAENYFTQAFRASSEFEASSTGSLGSVKETYPRFISRYREDYPRAVDEDDLDVNVLPAPTILYRQGLSVDDGLDILDDETSFDRCQAVSCDPNNNAQYFDDEDLFGRLNSDSDYFPQGGDCEQEDSEEEEFSEEDMLFGSGWDSGDTNALQHSQRESVRTTEKAMRDGDVAPRERIHAATEDEVQYFDADDLFEREDAEMLVYGRDEEIRWYLEPGLGFFRKGS